VKIGDRIKEIREKLGLNQGEFAKRLNFSQGALSDFEANKKHIADKYIRLICLEFGINEDWLRTGTGDTLKKEGMEILDEEGKPLNYEEGKFINTYRRLTDPNKEVARATVDALLKSQGGASEKQKNGETAGIGPKDSGETG